MHVYLTEIQMEKKLRKYQVPWLEHSTGETAVFVSHMIRTCWQEDLNFFLSLVALHAGDYYLFESESEDEEESQPEDQKPPKQTASQVRHNKHVHHETKTGSRTQHRAQHG